jgi:hypothetical protein
VSTATEQANPVTPRENQDRAWREWLVVGEGITALLSVLALIVALVALSQHSATTTIVKSATPAAGTSAGSGMAGMPGMSTAASAAAPQALTVAWKTDTEQGKKGPDGKWHDAALPANFTVHAGAKVTVTTENYDSSPHSFTAPGLAVNAIIAGGGSASSPSPGKFTFTAPAKPGRYLWRCTIPCDPFAMMTIGYMRGYVTVVA